MRVRTKRLRRLWETIDNENGVTMVFVAMSMLMMIGFTALAIDVGQIYNVRAELQTAADAASTAGARSLPNSVNAQTVAASYAAQNYTGTGAITSSSDIVVGTWDFATRTFVPGGTPFSAVEVTTRRAAVYGNPVQNVFAGVLGRPTTDVTAVSVSVKKKAVIDFEGIPFGAQPTSLYAGYGVSGDDLTGSVGVTVNGGFGGMIYDATCAGGPSSNCTGEDYDLYLPGQGGVFVISEDGDAADPDDLGSCPNNPTANTAPTLVDDPGDVTGDCTMVFDFRSFGDGLVTIDFVTLVDVEEDALVWLYRDGALVSEVTLQEAGDGMTAIRPVPGSPAVDFMVVKLNGSGAVDDIGYSETVQLVG